MTGVLDRMEFGLTPAYQRGMERLALAFGATGGTGITPVTPYDFQPYLVRYGRLPQSPRYLLSGVDATVAGTVRVWFTRDTGLPEGSVDVVVPAGSTVVVPVPGNAATITHTLRLTRFQPHPPSSGTAFAAIKRYAARMSAYTHPTVLFLCADRGTPYLDTVFDPTWATRLE